MHIVVIVLIVAACLIVYGIHRAGIRSLTSASADNANDDLRHKTIIGDLWAGAITPAAMPTLPCSRTCRSSARRRRPRPGIPSAHAL